METKKSLDNLNEEYLRHDNGMSKAIADKLASNLGMVLDERFNTY